VRKVWQVNVKAN